MKRTIPIFAALLGFVGFAQAQSGDSAFAIQKIDAVFEKTPDYNISIGPKRRADSKDWLIIEVEFGYETRDPKAAFLDELTFNYYILLKNQGPDFPQPTLLVGTVTHSAIPQGKGMRSAAFVSPRTLERFFGGRIPANAGQATLAVGVTITRQGQVVAEESIGEGKGRQQWWNQLQQTQGYVLNKNETPFAPLFGDYYESIKPRQGGM